MTHGSLESGLGGFDYAAEMVGWENVFHCEINPFCRTILNYYWPNAKSYSDIFEFDGLPWRGKVDILTAGFPCQPFSVAGKREGSTDDRFIWPANRRIIREIKPRCIVLENVTGLLSILQPNSISKVENKAFQLFGEGNKDEKVIKSIESVERRIIGTIIEEIKSEGYLLPCLADGTPIILCVPACAAGAVHRRDRIWIVAYSDRARSGSSRGNSLHQEWGTCKNRGACLQENAFRENGIAISNDRSASSDASHNSEQRLPKSRQTGIRELSKESQRGLYNRFEFNDRYATNCNNERLEKRKSITKNNGQEFKAFDGGFRNESWIEAATRLCGLDDELAGGLDTETISKSKWRTESLKAYGNAIYWPVAYEIFKAIEKA